MTQSAQSSKLRQIYLCYRSFLRSARAPSLGGRLVLLSASTQAPERAAAARIAGAAVLLVLEDEQAAKAAVREGTCDFLVTGLDEALRILKNEIRRRAPVGVCLRAPIPVVLREIVERGVQPDLLDCPEPTLAARGACTVVWKHALNPGEYEVAWTSEAGAGRAMEALDRLVFRNLENPDAERERWLQSAPPVLGRALSRRRWLPMRVEECARFATAVAGSLYAESTRVERDGLPIWPPPAS